MWHTWLIFSMQRSILHASRPEGLFDRYDCDVYSSTFMYTYIHFLLENVHITSTNMLLYSHLILGSDAWLPSFE